MGLGKGNSFVEVAALLPQLELASSITSSSPISNMVTITPLPAAAPVFGLCSRFRVGSAGSVTASSNSTADSLHQSGRLS